MVVGGSHATDARGCDTSVCRESAVITAASLQPRSSLSKYSLRHHHLLYHRINLCRLYFDFVEDY